MQSLFAETEKFARKDEMVLIERMLKDFQPLEFVRVKDVEKTTSRNINKKQNTRRTIEDL